MTHVHVRRRHVFFFAGFDPKGAAYYHGLYRQQAALQARATGDAYEVGARRRLPSGNWGWDVESRSQGGEPTFTTVEFAAWDDLVRQHWPRGAWQVFRGSVSGYVHALSAGVRLGGVWRTAPRTLIALAYPAVYWLGAVVLALLLALFVGAIASTLGAAPALAGAVGLSGFVAGLFAAVRLERVLRTSWLLRIYHFAGDWSRGAVPRLEDRLDRSADLVRQRLEDPAIDEVMVVGFSVGTMLAAAVTSRVKATAAPEALDRLSLLTLGHCIPLLALMPRSVGYRRGLAVLGQLPAVRWHDYSSPTDWGSFALVDPIALCTGPAPYVPVLASPRFHTLFGPETYQSLKADRQRLHMQYLMAGELPGGYDYFRLVAGPRRLGDGATPPTTENPLP